MAAGTFFCFLFHEPKSFFLPDLVSVGEEASGEEALQQIESWRCQARNGCGDAVAPYEETSHAASLLRSPVLLVPLVQAFIVFLSLRLRG